jgi:hypothetical protein
VAAAGLSLVEKFIEKLPLGFTSVAGFDSDTLFAAVIAFVAGFSLVVGFELYDGFAPASPARSASRSSMVLTSCTLASSLTDVDWTVAAGAFGLASAFT